MVVGFAGLLDLGYAAFFAIGSYTYGMLASAQLISSPIHHSVHVPFWIALFIGMFVAAGAGALLGAPTLRLRGDYLAIVTLGFGEIVPRFFRNMRDWTSGVNGISALDVPTLPFWITGPWASTQLAIEHNFRFVSFNPTAWYVLIVILIFVSVIGVNNLYRSRLGRAWMAVREDETAAAAMGVNTVNTKLLAFAIGASFSGFAGAFSGAKLSLVTPDSFTFIVSITILSMVVLGGMGNIPGAMIGALLLYSILYYFLPAAPAAGSGTGPQPRAGLAQHSVAERMARDLRIHPPAAVHPVRPDPGRHHAAAPSGPSAKPSARPGAEARRARRVRGRDRMSAQTEPPILSLQGVIKRFGGLTAVDQVSFDVPKGEVFALIGPNGAGKTTLFNCITGMHVPTAGKVVFEGQRHRRHQAVPRRHSSASRARSRTSACSST